MNLYCCSACFVWLFEVLEIELRALHMLAEHPTAELHPRPTTCYPKAWWSDSGHLTCENSQGILKAQFYLNSCCPFLLIDGCFEVGRRVIYRCLVGSYAAMGSRLRAFLFPQSCLVCICVSFGINQDQRTRHRSFLLQRPRSWVFPSSVLLGWPYFWVTEHFTEHFSNARLVNGQVWLL